MSKLTILLKIFPVRRDQITGGGGVNNNDICKGRKL